MMTTRRRLLQGITATGIGLGAARSAAARARMPGELRFLNLHTGERLQVSYADDVGYLDDGLAEINRLLRDHRTGDVHPIDPGVLDILNAARLALAPGGTFEIISGYRSPKTNAMLAAAGRAVAKRSLHMQGRAIDIRLTGMPTRLLRDCCVAMKRGGVGYYAKSNFVHVDTGRVRRW